MVQYNGNNIYSVNIDNLVGDYSLETLRELIIELTIKEGKEILDDCMDIDDMSTQQQTLGI